MFSLLTELHNGLASAELFATNLLLRVTLSFYFPNDLTYRAVVITDTQHPSHYPSFLNFTFTSSPATKTENLTKMQMKLEFREESEVTR